MEVEDILILRASNSRLKLEHASQTVSPLQKRLLENDFLAGRPFAYLTSFAEFYGRRFFVNENVLIPRPETELLVDLLVQGKRCFERVLDIGTGSGVILLALLDQEVAQEGTGVDVSEEALNVTRVNARKFRLESRVKLLQSDRFAHVHENYDLIVSNPPYIKASTQRDLVHPGVEKHEPHLALYLEDIEYENWFMALFQGVMKHLKADGLFMMEGHELELEGQAQTLRRLGFKDVSVLKDYAGLARFLRASL